MAAAAARGAAARGAAGIVYAVDRDERESMTKGDATKSFDLEGRRTARRLLSPRAVSSAPVHRTFVSGCEGPSIAYCVAC